MSAARDCPSAYNTILWPSLSSLTLPTPAGHKDNVGERPGESRPPAGKLSLCRGQPVRFDQLELQLQIDRQGRTFMLLRSYISCCRRGVNDEASQTERMHAMG